MSTKHVHQFENQNWTDKGAEIANRIDCPHMDYAGICIDCGIEACVHSDRTYHTS